MEAIWNLHHVQRTCQNGADFQIRHGRDSSFEQRLIKHFSQIVLQWLLQAVGYLFHFALTLVQQQCQLLNS